MKLNVLASAGEILRPGRGARRGALIFLLVMVAACVVGPLVLDAAGNRPSAATWQAPGAAHWFGTDGNGRDLLYRVLLGGRVSLLVAAGATAVSLVIGIAVGLCAGFFGGRIDAVLMRGVDLLYALPRVLFALIFIAVLDEPVRATLARWMGEADQAGNLKLKAAAAALLPYAKTLVLVVCIGAVEWLTMARIVRGEVLSLRERPFIEAARGLGLSQSRILLHHLLPNLRPVIVTSLLLTIPIVVLDESFLSFLGLGIDEPAASWGTLLKEGAAEINPLQTRWWLPVFPAAALILTLLALNSLGDNLREQVPVS